MAHIFHNSGCRQILTIAAASTAVVMSLLAPLASADHNGLHATACGEPDTVGGGELGNSPGGGTLGWDVGSGQCNGSFVVTRATVFQDANDAIELGLRIEQRKVGQVSRHDDNVYVVETGPDPTSVGGNRAWWNFHVSTAYDDISTLTSLILTIETLVGPNQPLLPSFDLSTKPFDSRNVGGTAEYPDIYQISHNPEFGWFAPAVDSDANPNGNFDYDAEGIWRFTLEAKGAGGAKLSVSMCVRTRNAAPLDNSRSPCEKSGSGKSQKSNKSKKSKK